MKKSHGNLKAVVFSLAREKSLTLRKLAARAGVSQSYFSEVLSGKKNLKPSLGFKIARELGLSPSSFYQSIGKEDEALMERFRRCIEQNPEFVRKADDMLTAEEGCAE